MDFLSRRRGRKLGALAVAAGLAVAVLVAAVVVLRQPVPGHRRGPCGSRWWTGRADNQHVVLDATLLHPAAAAAGSRRSCSPTGSGRPRTRSAPEAEQLARAGFAVLTWSPARHRPVHRAGRARLAGLRGQGRRASWSAWLARQPRVLLDGPGDPRVGITGASYGGGLALLAAAYDHRIDADRAAERLEQPGHRAVPERGGRRPAAGVQEAVGGCCSPGQWAGLLFTQGSAGFGAAAAPAAAGQRPAGRGPPACACCGRFLPSDLRHVPAGRHRPGRPRPQAVSLLQRSSPASVAGRMDAPTLLIQGEHDSLFGLGPGRRELPGHPAQRRARGHGLVRAAATTAATRRPAG